MPKRNSICSSESFDDTSLYRIAGAALRKMRKQRYSAKFFSKLSTKRQNISKDETPLMKHLCFKKTEKQKHNNYMEGSGSENDVRLWRYGSSKINFSLILFNII